MARMQVRMNHPYLFTEEAKGQLFMIDVEPSFTEKVAEALGIGDTYASLFNDGYNPLSNRFLTPKEQMDTKVLALFSLGLPEVRGLKFSKDVGKVSKKSAESGDLGWKLSHKAPLQTTPGVSQLKGVHINDKGRAEPWVAHYDKFGRQIARTDYTTGIHGIHHHTREHLVYPELIKVTDHIKGEY